MTVRGRSPTTGGQPIATPSNRRHCTAADELSAEPPQLWSAGVYALRAGLLLTGLLWGIATPAAQLAGVPPPLPPGLDRKLQIYFANDVFSAGANDDDFRTQQFSVSADFGDGWTGLIDHSLLTNRTGAAGPARRIDQLTASVGRTFFPVQDDQGSRFVQAGSGLRYSGKIGGARIQNGFHQLIGSDIRTMPYIDDNRTALTLWGLYRQEGLLADDVRLPLAGGEWRLRYWARATALTSTDGELDGNLSLNLVARKRWFQGWFGVQANLREGHGRNPVELETARYEDGVSAVAGLRLGPLIIETERQLGSSGGYGYFGLVSRGEPITWPGKIDGFELQTTITQPDVYAVLQGRWRSAPDESPLLTTARYWAVDLSYGSPQFDGRPDRFVRTRQIGIVREWSARVAGYEWLQGYVAAGPGWRRERVFGEGDALGNQSSAAVGRVGLLGSLGLRFGTQTRRQDRRRLLLQFGLRGWLPTSAGRVAFAGESLRLQKPQISIDAGVMFVFR